MPEPVKYVYGPLTAFYGLFRGKIGAADLGDWQIDVRCIGR